ncbi:UNVERIFIED_CONTAM: hypothetical protein HDU68_004052 [Siphonaria sp. JEL0065]|nr:hypothetical protein HDU68_004052 [Siphonaria sp. JEL0065]
MNSTRNKAYRALKKSEGKKKPSIVTKQTLSKSSSTPSISVRNPTPPATCQQQQQKQARRHSETCANTSNNLLEPSAPAAPINVRSNSTPPQPAFNNDPVMQWLLSPVAAYSPMPQSPMVDQTTSANLFHPLPLLTQQQQLQLQQSQVECKFENAEILKDLLFDSEPSSTSSSSAAVLPARQQSIPTPPYISSTNSLFSQSSMYSCYSTQMAWPQQQPQYTPRMSSDSTIRHSRSYSDIRRTSSPYKNPKKNSPTMGSVSSFEDEAAEVLMFDAEYQGAGPIGISFTAAELNLSVENILADCKMSEEFMSLFQQ